jgi:hypothetical protein
MEFSYRVSETEYLSAWKLRRGAVRRGWALKIVLFWVFILVCLVLLWTIVKRQNRSHEGVTNAPAMTRSNIESETSDSPASSGSVSRKILFNVGPFLLLGGIWFFMLLRLGPRGIRSMYTKDPMMQGQFTVNITPESISVRNTAGTSSQTGWNIYERWCDGKDVIVLLFRSGTYFIVGLTGLSEFQRNELRGILALALPGK